ncbi:MULTISPECIES: GNAT family N-acetyltransferase [unclassified Streptomyces]|uniref:GNAT family N-acetyltransferase n=1 Tax=unclassified Streptomyces TaxID=2593676 RepID=UPI0022520F34|nr:MULTISPECIES: GNAT family N-acetyltransferase [unclassified Streptomyces]MCX4530919.1 GNAT family N-acetyltransferase [Streptomyces sp. NBC_01669]WSA03336.1 GNAT family N-acetyltransferase [Streptomyces sp. NBC_00841]WSJ93873.1 GNAT family N-acetyltransferase [Streptomyces sp. NBC_01320]
MRDVELSDGFVTLSPLCPDDVDAHLAGEDDQLVRWLSGGPGTRAGVEKYVEHCMEQWAVDGPLRAFGIRAGSRKVLAGSIDLRFDMAGLAPGQVNIAYGLYPDWRGQGLATRAVALVRGYAAAAGATQGVIKVDPENGASVAVARRAGFTCVKQVPEADGALFNWYVHDLRSAPPQG